MKVQVNIIYGQSQLDVITATVEAATVFDAIREVAGRFNQDLKPITVQIIATEMESEK